MSSIEDLPLPLLLIILSAVALVVIYVVFDIFFWDGGFVNPSFLSRLSDSLGV